MALCTSTKTTHRARQLSGEQGYVVFNVSDVSLLTLFLLNRMLTSRKAKSNSKVKDPKTVSSQSHRVGFHFHRTILAQVLKEDSTARGIHIASYASTKGAISSKKSLAEYGASQAKKSPQSPKVSGKRDTDWTEFSPAVVYDLIKEEFPKVPEQDLKLIMEQSFFGVSRHSGHKSSANAKPLGQRDGMVGRAKDLTLPRRIQLAVLSHIRHVHTPYEQHLKVMQWGETRLIVEEHCIEKLKEWRGEDPESTEYGAEHAIAIDSEESTPTPPLKPHENRHDNDQAWEEELITEGAREHYRRLRGDQPDSFNGRNNAIVLQGRPSESRPAGAYLDPNYGSPRNTHYYHATQSAVLGSYTPSHPPASAASLHYDYAPIRQSAQETRIHGLKRPAEMEYTSRPAVNHEPAPSHLERPQKRAANLDNIIGLLQASQTSRRPEFAVPKQGRPVQASSTNNYPFVFQGHGQSNTSSQYPAFSNAPQPFQPPQGGHIPQLPVHYPGQYLPPPPPPPPPPRYVLDNSQYQQAGRMPHFGMHLSSYKRRVQKLTKRRRQ